MTLRSWATPLVIATFAVSGVTGILMFLHADSGLNKLAHEWIGLAMVAAVLAHLVLNWRAFTTYFRRPLAQVIMAAGLGVLGLSFIGLGGGPAGGPEAAIRAMAGALGDAPVSELALLAHKDEAQVMADLAAAGVTVTSGDQTLAAVAGDDARRLTGLIVAVLAPAQPGG